MGNFKFNRAGVAVSRCNEKTYLVFKDGEQAKFNLKFFENNNCALVKHFGYNAFELSGKYIKNYMA